MNEFLKATKGCMNVRLREPANQFFSAFGPVIEQTYEMINSKETIEEIDNAINTFENKNKKNKSIFSLIKLELSSFVDGYVKTTGASENTLEDPPAVKSWLSKKVTAKDMLKAAKTIIDSLMDALGDILPKWVKGILNTLKEVFDFAIG